MKVSYYSPSKGSPRTLPINPTIKDAQGAPMLYVGPWTNSLSDS